MRRLIFSGGTMKRIVLSFSISLFAAACGGQSAAPVDPAGKSDLVSYDDEDGKADLVGKKKLGTEVRPYGQGHLDGIYVVVARPKAEVEKLLPKSLELMELGLTAAGTHPVLVLFGGHTNAMKVDEGMPF